VETVARSDRHPRVLRAAIGSMNDREKLMRELQFNIRFSKEEGARLDAVAKHYGISQADAIRMLLKRELDAIKAVDRRR
jgi:DNA-directed RNA polymerase specialized sigma subunit